MSRWLTPPTIGKQLGVSAETVVGWIRAGELAAVNVADPRRRRPRFRVNPIDLSAFLERRSAKPATAPVQRRRRADRDVIAYW